jgi:aminoglycoside/choline kinase family phosphotransferase
MHHTSASSTALLARIHEDRVGLRSSNRVGTVYEVPEFDSSNLQSDLCVAVTRDEGSCAFVLRAVFGRLRWC